MQINKLELEHLTKELVMRLAAEKSKFFLFQHSINDKLEGVGLLRVDVDNKFRDSECTVPVEFYRLVSDSDGIPIVSFCFEDEDEEVPIDFCVAVIDFEEIRKYVSVFS
jgi:hypothetical protein